jgi:hypothetical protein
MGTGKNLSSFETGGFGSHNCCHDMGRFNLDRLLVARVLGVFASEKSFREVLATRWGANHQFPWGLVFGSWRSHLSFA